MSSKLLSNMNPDKKIKYFEVSEVQMSLLTSQNRHTKGNEGWYVLMSH